MKQEIIQKRLRGKFIKQGVKMTSPETIFFELFLASFKIIYI